MMYLMDYEYGIHTNTL